MEKTLQFDNDVLCIVPSNEAMLKALNLLCEVRHSLIKAKLSDMELEAITPNLESLMSNLETLFVNRIRDDFPIPDVS